MSPAGKAAMLTCGPSGGTHPNAHWACTELTEADGDFDALSVEQGRMCTMLYDPVTVTANGSWRGRTIHYQKTFGNDCQLEGTTGAVFRF
jgi:hypothetical protein